MKIAAVGFSSFFKDSFNFFDGVVVAFSTLDLIVSNLIVNINIDAVTALRAFRILRIFKLSKTWRQLHQLLKTMWKTLVDIASFTVVLFLFMFVYTILGMEVFAEKAKFSADDKVDMINGESIPMNFDSFLWSFTTVFVLLTEDGWSYVFYQYHRAVGAFRANLYFISLFIIGPRILLNLFLAILLENFEDGSLEEEAANSLLEFNYDDLTFVEKVWYNTQEAVKRCFNGKSKNAIQQDPDAFAGDQNEAAKDA